MISRGTARPGQVAAAQFTNEMARGAEALRGQQIGNEAGQFKLEADKQGLGALLRAFEKFKKAGTPPPTRAANTEDQETPPPPPPQATVPGVPMQPTIPTPPLPPPTIQSSIAPPEGMMPQYPERKKPKALGLDPFGFSFTAPTQGIQPPTF